MDVDLRIMPFDIAEEVFVPLQRKRGMQAALHQDLVATNRHHLLDFVQDDPALQHVAFGMFRPAVKRTEITDRRADVGVVDVAIDVVRAKGLRMEPSSDGICGPANRCEVVRLKKSHGVSRREPFTGNDVVENRCNRADVHRAVVPVEVGGTDASTAAAPRASHRG